MPYRFLADERLSDGLRRIVAEQSQIIHAGLNQAKAPHKGLYEARKAFKRLRALLRLVRTSLGETTFRAENERLRDSANLLAPARDGFVVVQTLDRLLALVDDPKPYAKLRRRWLKEADAQLRAVLDDAALRQGLNDSLEALATRAADWRLWPSDGFALLAADLRATYRAGRRCRATLLLLPEPHAEDFHEWRKRVKHLWYQLSLLEELGGLDTRIAALDALGEKLGQGHDWEVLADKLRAEGQLALVELADEQRRALERQALEDGAALYRGRPREFLGHIWTLFDAWQTQRRSSP